MKYNILNACHALWHGKESTEKELLETITLLSEIMDYPINKTEKKAMVYTLLSKLDKKEFIPYWEKGKNHENH